MSVRRESNLTKNKKEGVFFVLAAGSLWGLMGLLVRSLAAVGLGTMEINFIRSIITFLSLLTGLLIFDRKALQIKIKDLWCFLGTGACSVAFFNFCYFRTITITSLSVAAVLLYTAPTFVMLLSALLFRERLTVQKLAALVLAFLGCAFVSGIIGTEPGLTPTGILFGLGAGFGYALYSIFGRYALERGYGSVTITFYTFLFSSISTFLFVDTGEILKAFNGNLPIIMKTVFLVLLVTLLPYVSYTRGLKDMENGTASLLASVEPAVATMLGVIVYRERLHFFHVFGILLVFASIVLIHIEFPRKRNRKRNRKRDNQ